MRLIALSWHKEADTSAASLLHGPGQKAHCCTNTRLTKKGTPVVRRAPRIHTAGTQKARPPPMHVDLRMLQLLDRVRRDTQEQRELTRVKTATRSSSVMPCSACMSRTLSSSTLFCVLASCTERSGHKDRLSLSLSVGTDASDCLLLQLYTLLGYGSRVTLFTIQQKRLEARVCPLVLATCCRCPRLWLFLVQKSQRLSSQVNERNSTFPLIAILRSITARGALRHYPVPCIRWPKYARGRGGVLTNLPVLLFLHTYPT